MPCRLGSRLPKSVSPARYSACALRPFSLTPHGCRCRRPKDQAAVLRGPLVGVLGHRARALDPARIDAKPPSWPFRPVLGPPDEHLVVGGRPEDARAGLCRGLDCNQVVVKAAMRPRADRQRSGSSVSSCDLLVSIAASHRGNGIRHSKAHPAAALRLVERFVRGRAPRGMPNASASWRRRVVEVTQSGSSSRRHCARADHLRFDLAGCGDCARSPAAQPTVRCTPHAIQ